MRDDLLLPGTGASTGERGRLVDVLAGVDRPESIHTWKRNPQVTHLLRGLGDGTIPFTHTGFDLAPAGAAREHTRELLGHHGLLPRRDPDLARFERWLAQRLDTIHNTHVRQPLEQFARWHHLRRIRRRVGENLQGPVHAAKQEITEAGRFLAWLAGRDSTLATCRQADIDEWLAGGPTTRHLVRTFIVWSRQQRLCADLSIGFRQPQSARVMTQNDRVEWLGRCLDGDMDTLCYRVAAMFLLLYAQPLVRVAAMRTEQLQVGPSGILILFGDEPAPVPDPFTELVRDHLADRPNLRTTNTNGSPWLFPGYRAGRHLSAQSIMIRLRTIGIDLLGARNAALRELARHVPAPIIATQLGYSHQITHRHAELAAQPMSSYVAIRTSQQ